MVARELDIQEALVVAQIQIHLSPVFENVNLAVLKWAHEPGVDVDVGIDLDGSDFIAPVHEQPADGCCGYAFPKPAHHSACDHDVSHIHAFRSEEQNTGKI